MTVVCRRETRDIMNDTAAVPRRKPLDEVAHLNQRGNRSLITEVSG